MPMKRLQRGDTLIEVMLATAMIGMVIGASYASASRALRTGRFAQEQTEALKVAESQVEKLKYIASLGLSADPATQNIFDTSAGNTTFCIDDSFHRQSPGNAVCQDISGLYKQSITYSGAPTDTFTVEVTWTQIGSSNKGSVKIAYRLHK